MPTLREKINETEPGRWSNFLSEFLFRYSFILETKNNPKIKCGVGTDLVADPAHALTNLALYLEGLAFKEVARMVEKEAGWVIELQNKMKRTD